MSKALEVFSPDFTWKEKLLICSVMVAGLSCWGWAGSKVIGLISDLFH